MSRDTIDARPFLRASSDSLWAKAEGTADNFVASIRDELAKLNINAAVTRTPNGTHPTVVRMDAWIPPSKGSPLGRTVRRISLTLTCGVRPFNRTKNVCDVGISRDGREKRVLGLLNVKPAEVQGWVRYALGVGDNPRGSEGFTIALVSLIGLPMLSPRHNPFDKKFRNGFPPPIPVMLFWLGALSIVIGIGMMQTPTDSYRESYPYYPEEPAAEIPADPYYAEPAPYSDPAPAPPADYAPPPYPAEEAPATPAP
jgi:hypothetical protein